MGAHEDVAGGGEEVEPQKAVSVGAVGPGHPLEEAHRLLDDQLEPPGHVLEAGDDEHAEQRRHAQKQRRHQKGGDQAGVGVFQVQEADLSRAVEDGVPHGLLHALGAAG